MIYMRPFLRGRTLRHIIFEKSVLVVGCCYTRKFLAFKEFKRSSAAGGNMGHPAAISQLVYSCSGITSADNRSRVGIGQSCGNGLCSCCQNAISASI